MKKNRQDAWTQDEDLLLAEVVLRHIREGSTQLAAFEEVGEKLARTSAACGFRWNSLVRKKYETAVNLAKKQRKKGNTEQEEVMIQEDQDNEVVETQATTVETTNADKAVHSISIDDMVAFLQSLKDIQGKQQKLEEQNATLEKQVSNLEKEKNATEHKYNELQREYQLMNEDYKALIGIMERARKMVIMQDELESNLKFQMDYNGNLEKVNKK